MSAKPEEVLTPPDAESDGADTVAQARPEGEHVAEAVEAPEAAEPAVEAPAAIAQSADIAAVAAPAEEEASEAVAAPVPGKSRGRSAAASVQAGNGTGMVEADFEASLREPEDGDVIDGVIVHIDRDGILVDVGAKSEGLVRPNEISRAGEQEELHNGDHVRVVVIGRDKDDGRLLLSKKRADFERAWDRVIEAMHDKRIIHAMVTERVKGGLVVDLGIRGFVPASHVGSGDFKHINLDKYVGQSVPLKVIEVDREKRKVILSHKLATVEERDRKRDETLGGLKEGEIREGIVRRVTDYGAFIDLGGIDGLLHVSEMSWARVNHPSEVVKVGDTLQVMILKLRLDENPKRISLGLRQILPDPWEQVAGKYNVGDTIKATVSRLVPFGAFVLLEGGVEAIIPNSELATRRVSKPQDVVNPGDEVEARVIEMKPEERKLTLSIRRIQEESQRAQETQARETEYREFREFSKKRREPERGVTLGDVFSEQFARARKEVSRKGKGGKTEPNQYDVTSEEEEE
jgi:4-hydroxy-3-methylbut-2-enyl diphosphate reductase